MKRITSIFLCFLMLLSAISFQVFADEAEGAVQGDTAEGLTNEWYGGLNLVITEDGVDEAVITDDVLAVLEKYLALRELSFNNPEGKADFAIFADSAEAEKLFAERNADVDVYETNINSIIDFAEVTLKIEGAEVKDGVYTLAVYEWTFYDYFDKAGEMKVTDVSGYGVDHEMTLEYVDGKMVITADEYLDDTLNFDEFAAASSAQAKADAENGNGLLAEDFEADTNGEFIAGYNIGAAVAYSDTYWSNYNPDWYNFAPLGGDCANFVSQCLLAGGMPMHYGAAYSSNCWFYNTSSDRSGSWTGAKESWHYWSTYRGNGIVNPGNGDIWIGCPVYVDWASDGVIDHAYFCVGRNSAGTAIINSHTSDKYHCNWDYGYYYSTYYTVQVTQQEGASVTIRRELDGQQPIDIGADFCAHIRHPASGLYLTDQDYNVSAQPGTFGTNQVWRFVRQGDGSYSIGTPSLSFYMDVAGANYSDGANIQMYEGNGSYAQRFFIYYYDGTYHFKTVTEDKTFDLDAASNNLQLYGGSAGMHLSELEVNARSFEILKLQIDGSSWNAYIGQQFECYIRNWHTGHLMTAEGDNVIFRDPAFTDNQKWIVTRNEYGGHEIKSATTGKVLDVAGAQIGHSIDIDLYDPNGSKAQNFFFIDTGEARFYIKPSYSHLVVDMDADNMEIHTCYYGTGESQLRAQVYEFITVNQIKDDLSVTSPEYFGKTFTAKVFGNADGKYLTDNNGVSMADANNSNNQIWTFTYDEAWQAYKVIGSSGKALDVVAGGWANATGLQMYDSNDTAAQRFRFYQAPGGGYYISPANTQKIFDIDTNTGTVVHLYGNTPEAHRLFGVTILTHNGKKPVDLGATFTTHIKHKATGLFLTGKAEGVLNCTNTESKWTFKRQADGSYEIINNSLNKALDIQGGEIVGGTNVQLWDANGSLAQRFFVYAAGDGYILRSAKGIGCVDMDANSKEVHIYANADGIAYDPHVFTFETVELNSISVSKNPTKTTYTVGDTLDTTGLTIKATYSDGTTKTVTSGFTVSPSGKLTTAGTKTITVTYSGKTTTFKVTVNEKVTLSSISVSKNPTKTTYTVGDTLDTAGLTIKATYSDGTSKTLTSGFTVSPSGVLSTAGTKTITVTYSGKTTTFKVTVNEKVADETVLVLKPSSNYAKVESYVTKVGTGAIASAILAQFDNTNTAVFDKEGNQVTSSAICGTGYTVNLIANGEVIDSLTIIVAGDVDGNGKVDTTDYLRIKAKFNGTYDLSGVEFIAGDVCADEKIDTTDYLRIKGAFLGTYTLG